MAALSNLDLSDLIGRIYDCALDPSRWEPTLAAIARALNGERAILSLNDLQQDRSLIRQSAGCEPHWLEVRESHLPEVHAALRPWLMQRPGLDEPFVATRELPAAHLAASPYVQECLRPQGIADVAHFFLISTLARFSELILFWQDRHGPMSAGEIELGGLLLPHLRRAVTISNILDVQTIKRACMAETLDALKVGVLLADAESRILHANRAAAAMLQDGGPLRARGGVLGADGPASAEISAAIGLAARNESGIGKAGLSVRLTAESEAPVVAHVLPLVGGEIRSRINPAAVAAVFVNWAGDDEESAQAVAAAFGLTPAETRVLSRILSGKTAVEAAADLGVAATTARTHLDSIFAKTGVSRQSELVRLAARTVPPVARRKGDGVKGDK